MAEVQLSFFEPQPSLEPLNNGYQTSTGSARIQYSLGSSDTLPHLEGYAHHEGDHTDMRTSVKRSWFKLWWMEMLSVIFSMVCLATNVGVLATLDGKPYERWRFVKVDVTPNAVISVVSTFR